MNVFLTHSYFYPLDPKQWKNHTPYPPLATITALALLRQEGFSAVFHDVALENGPASCIARMRASHPDVVVIYEDGFNYLTKMCLTTMRHACFEMIRAAKELGATVVVSGSDATDHYGNYHEQGADYIVHGEGEMTLLELLRALREGTETRHINGLSFLLEGLAAKTPARSNLKDPDQLPMAAWDAVDIPAYREKWSRSKFPFTLNVATTRGCPFKCNWCAKPIYGNRYNSRSPEKVAAELAYLQQHFGVQHVWMTDDIFGLKPGWVARFREAVQQAGIHVRYKIQSRADLLMQDSTIDDLAASGLEEVWIGAESGSQKILDAMDKGTTLDQIRTSTQLLQKKGVRVAYFLQFGYPGETREDIRKTLDMVRTNQPDDIGISVSYPLPGTLFYDRVKSELGDKANWKDSDDLDLMFKGTFSRSYYRVLQRYVHHLFRLQTGWARLLGRKKSTPVRYTLLIPYNLFMRLWMGARLSWMK